MRLDYEGTPEEKTHLPLELHSVVQTYVPTFDLSILSF